MDLEKAIEEAIEVLKNREYDCKDAVTGAWDVFLCDYFANNSTIVTQSTPIRLTTLTLTEPLRRYTPRIQR